MTAATQIPPIVVIGAGLSGLSCACTLTSAGQSVLVLEAADGPGGRVRTDTVEGFRLDRGFQVFFNAYPEAQRLLNYDRLDLQPFVAGALVRVQGQFHRVLDPYRSPIGSLSGIAAPVGTLGDKLRVLSLRRRATSLTLDEIFALPDRTTREELRSLGFSDTFIRRFFTPFLGGIFLDVELTTSSRMLYFVYKMLAEGDITIPAAGMQAIPDSLVATLPPGTVRFGARVCAIRRSGTQVTGLDLDSGEQIGTNRIVVATEMVSAHALTGVRSVVERRSVACLYFSAPDDPVRAPILVLDGDNRGPVANLCVPSRVSRSYAPPGRSLISATVIGEPGGSDGDLERAVRGQMSEWYGAPVVERWRHLRTYRIPWAQFDQSPAALSPAARQVRESPGVYVCGDHVENASINGALRSGRRAAEAVLEDLGTR